MNHAFQRIIEGLGARREGSSWEARCPCHEDKTGSLDLVEKGGKVLLKCFAGYEQREVIETLRDRGLWPASRSPSALAYVARTPKQKGSQVILVTP